MQRNFTLTQCPASVADLPFLLHYIAHHFSEYLCPMNDVVNVVIFVFQSFVAPSIYLFQHPTKFNVLHHYRIILQLQQQFNNCCCKDNDNKIFRTATTNRPVLGLYLSQCLIILYTTRTITRTNV